MNDEGKKSSNEVARFTTEAVIREFESVVKIHMRKFGGFTADKVDDLMGEWMSRICKVDFNLVKNRGGYCYMIAHNLCLSLRRKLDKEATDSLDNLPETASRQSVATDVAFRETVMRVEAYLATMPEIDHAAIRLRAEEMSYDDIATKLGVPLQTVKLRIEKVRRRFRNSHLFDDLNY